jgi:hypothetical protein
MVTIAPTHGICVPCCCTRHRGSFVPLIYETIESCSTPCRGLKAQDSSTCTMCVTAGGAHPRLGKEGGGDPAGAMQASCRPGGVGGMEGRGAVCRRRRGLPMVLHRRSWLSRVCGAPGGGAATACESARRSTLPSTLSSETLAEIFFVARVFRTTLGALPRSVATFTTPHRTGRACCRAHRSTDEC